MISELERAIRDGMLAATRARIQADIERLAADLRSQGASEQYILDAAEWFSEENTKQILAGARDCAQRLTATGFFDECPAR